MSESVQRVWQFYVDDMIACAEKVIAYTDGLDQAGFVASGLHYDATVRNLERKGYLSSEKLGNTYRYAPRVATEEYRQRFVSTLVGSYFRNSYKELVSFFAQEQKISAAELQDIIAMIEKGQAED